MWCKGGSLWQFSLLMPFFSSGKSEAKPVTAREDGKGEWEKCDIGREVDRERGWKYWTAARWQQRPG